MGKTFTHDGVELYYEVYGTGEPLLLVHGNGGSIADFRLQIEDFRTKYKVIAMDSRDQGKSGDSPGEITYEQMTDDLSALLDETGSGSVNVLGWSDGGIEALLLGVRHPGKVKKIVAMAPNLNSTDQAVYPEIIEKVKRSVQAKTVGAEQTAQGKRDLKVSTMMLLQPHIEPRLLKAISVPTLVMIGDHDLVREEHALAIFRNIPNSELCIISGATHLIHYDDSSFFDSIVLRFLTSPYKNEDRIKDMITSLKKMRGLNKH